MDTISIRWCHDLSQAELLAGFIVRNVTSAYISHYEVMAGLASELDAWAPDHLEHVTAEYRAILSGAMPESRLAIVTDDAGQIIGVVTMGFHGERHYRHAVIEDLVVQPDLRGRGTGKKIIGWIKDEAVKDGCKRLFLESGKANDRAHAFFKTEGFLPISETFHLDLRGL